MMATRSESPIVVVGAGAAGLMAAIWAAQGPRPVILLEGSGRPGQKILISGGGRCNVLPDKASADAFRTDGSPNTLRKVLAAWPLAHVRRFFEQDLDVPLVLEPETGKLFPASNKARSVLDALLAAASRRGVGLRLGARVSELARTHAGWALRLSSGEVLTAGRVVLATGGLSVPATGSDGHGLRLAETLGHALQPTYPALTPLTTGNAAHRELAGVSLVVTLNTAQGRVAREVRGGFLFTHRGYSGPAVLNVSHVATRPSVEGEAQPAIWVRWTDMDPAYWDALLRTSRGSALALLRRHLPERLAAQLLSEAVSGDVDLSHLPREGRQQLVEAITHYRLPWSGHEGYRVAEVTGGGVRLDQVNPATMESRIAPGLYLCGEMLDAFGPIGGYNFLWAWVTGRSAGLACSRSD